MKGSPSENMGAGFTKMLEGDDGLKGQQSETQTGGKQEKGTQQPKGEAAGQKGQGQKAPSKPRAPKPSSNTASPAAGNGVTTVASNEAAARAGEKADKGLGLNKDGTFRQANSGRRAMDETKKKVQLSITIPPAIKKELETAAEGKNRTANNYLSEYVVIHAGEILAYIKEQVF